MRTFLGDNFLLYSEAAEQLYHQHASKMPIIDYHCHLSPEDIAKDRQFQNVTEIWLEGDHYKWRAMRANGIDERYITGSANDADKFEKWAETVPFTMRNPLYQWTHLELKRYFGIDTLLKKATAQEVYEQCGELLRSPEFSARNILKKMKVEVVCTTDDPADSLEHHLAIQESGFSIKVLPTFRPDKAMAVENPEEYHQYLDKLRNASGNEIRNYQGLMDAIQSRHDFFHQVGGRLSDHGLEQVYAEPFTESEIQAIFDKVLKRQSLTVLEIVKFKSALLVEFGRMDHEKAWVQQFHLGALRNNNSRLLSQLGPDTGFDSMGDFEQGRALSAFLDKLESSNQLTKTILYNLNPRDNELFATMIGNFNDGSVPGKMQFGSGWWFLDQKDGMEKQLNALSNMGLLSRFVGMLTDSRSFMSYPRHEYFRRTLCNMLGQDVQNGELPPEMEWLGQMVENISYHNAKAYFQF
ncbi:glucuronate isomerase [Rapidithrix thailandica]|uniref:Uronate isomerase n=1 Tax=Rapidithrix thailandica TaxID=413964 RepID=A0AAW9SE60_9BACT